MLCIGLATQQYNLQDENRWTIYNLCADFLSTLCCS